MIMALGRRRLQLEVYHYMKFRDFLAPPSSACKMMPCVHKFGKLLYSTHLIHRNSDERTRWVALATSLEFLRSNEWSELKAPLIKKILEIKLLLLKQSKQLCVFHRGPLNAPPISANVRSGSPLIQPPISNAVGISSNPPPYF